MRAQNFVKAAVYPHDEFWVKTRLARAIHQSLAKMQQSRYSDCLDCHAPSNQGKAAQQYYRYPPSFCR